MFREVSASLFGAVPFVVLLDQDVPGQAQQRGGVRERAVTTSVLQSCQTMPAGSLRSRP